VSTSSEQPTAQGTADAAKRRPALGLFVPPQAEAPADSVLLDPKKTEDWFESLPKANVGETARRVYSALVDFNRMRLPPLTRARNAEQFRQPVDYICNNLRRHFVDSGFPLREKGQKAAALARALHQELAISYKSIIQDLLGESSERIDRKLLVIALHRATHSLGEVLHYSSLVYGPCPTGLWRELNAIYAFAWQNRIQQIQVRHGAAKSDGQSTLEDAYIAILLFATAMPQRLRQGQQLALIEALPEWTRHVSLGMPDEGLVGSGQFQVDLFADGPPLHDAADAPAANRRLRRVDAQRLLSHLRELFEQTPWQGSAGSDTRGNRLSRQLLRLILQSWSSAHERRFMRTRLKFELSVIPGLSRLHDHLLRLGGGADEADDEGEERYGSSFLQPQQDAAVDAWSEPYSHGASVSPVTVEADGLSDSMFAEIAFGPTTPSEPATPPPQTPVTDAGHPVRTVNESAGGYCIQWQGTDLPRVRVGELLGIQAAGGEGEFSLAAIRWLRQEPDQALRFGVEILAPQCNAGEVSPTGESRKHYPSTPQRCLLLPAAHGQGNSCIILPSALYNVGASLKLKRGDDKQVIQLSQVVETTGAYARYQYETARTDNGPSAHAGPADDFDDLWTNL
jgi:hypothetical protein